MLEGYLGTEKSKKTGSNNAAQYAQNDHRSKTECQQIGYQNLGPKTYYATLTFWGGASCGSGCGGQC